MSKAPVRPQGKQETAKPVKSSIKELRASSRKDTIVAVRMPKGLVDELKDIQKVNHFMDLSDEIRFILRKNCAPGASGQAGAELESALIESKKKEQLIDDLNRIIDQLKSSRTASNGTEEAQR